MNIFKKLFKNKKGSQIVEKVMIFAFSVAAGGAVILYTSNVIVEAKNRNGAPGILNGVGESGYISESAASDNLTYQLNGDSYTVTGCTGDAPANLVIPSEYEGKKVTRIGNNAFSYRNTIQTVKIGYNVEYLEYSCFHYCRNLTSVSLPESITGAASSIFSGDNKLTDINFPSKLTTLPSYYLFTTKISITTLPRTVTRIDEWALASCYYITTFNIPNSVTTIGAKAFDYSYSIRTMNMEAPSKPAGWNDNWFGSEWWTAEKLAQVTFNWGVSM